MALIVGIHGIAQQFKGEEVLKAEWLPALRDGLRRAGVESLDEGELHCAFYGDLFRGKGKAGGEEPVGPEVVTDEFEKALLEAWHEEAVRLGYAPPLNANGQMMAGELTKGTPRLIQACLNGLSNLPTFVRITESAMIGDLRQVRLYMNDATFKRQIRQRIEAVIKPDTRVVVAHSLGSVVAYECLCNHPEWNVTTLVTLGSPLGIRNLIFERLQPAPVDKEGSWPGTVDHWVNIADKGDVVALRKNLAECFGDEIRDHLIDNGVRAHDAGRYLTAEETGRAITLGLSA